jgi:lipoate-protein ligase A
MTEFYEILLRQLKNKEALDSPRVELTHHDLRIFIALVEKEIRKTYEQWEWNGS